MLLVLPPKDIPPATCSSFLCHHLHLVNTISHLRSFSSLFATFPISILEPSKQHSFKIAHRVFCGFLLNLEPNSNSYCSLECAVDSTPCRTFQPPGVPLSLCPLNSGHSGLLLLLEKPDRLLAQSHCSCCLLNLESTYCHFA